jgi:hypothetical protein
MIKLTGKFFNYWFTALLGIALLFLFVPTAQAQETVTTEPQKETTAVNRTADETPKPKLEPVYRDYKSVRIGMKMDEVRDTLSKLKDKGDSQDFFVISDNEMAQVFYDKDGLVRAISVTYTGDLKKAPIPINVFGEELTAKEDGSMFKMMRYAEAGYWISYSRTGGDNAIVTITMQKL